MQRCSQRTQQCLLFVIDIIIIIIMATFRLIMIIIFISFIKIDVRKAAYK